MSQKVYTLVHNSKKMKVLNRENLEKFANGKLDSKTLAEAPEVLIEQQTRVQKLSNGEETLGSVFGQKIRGNLASLDNLFGEHQIRGIIENGKLNEENRIAKSNCTKRTKEINEIK